MVHRTISAKVLQHVGDAVSGVRESVVADAVQEEDTGDIDFALSPVDRMRTVE